VIDLVIRGGTVIDGTGAPGFTADVAVSDGRIVEVGRVQARGRREIAADGLLVTPGWVDVHSHYDGQVTWDERLTPSFWHGVTTTVFGNCGVGFAPVRADRREWLVGLMEGVEDIPGTALSDGIDWRWETFPQYLDAIASRPLAMDVGAQIAHGPLRAYAMGDRGALNEPASPEDIARMGELAAEAMRAGALGLSTSRTVVHRAIDGEPVPGTFAAHDELEALAQAVAGYGGVLELAPAGLLGEDQIAPARELAWMHSLSAQTGAAITFLFGQNHVQPDFWREQLAACERAHAEGARVHPQMFCRAIGMMISLESRENPFSRSAAFRSLAHLAHGDRISALLGDAELRARIVEEGADDVLGRATRFSQWDGVYRLDDGGLNYEPAPEQSIAAIARAQQRPPRAVALDAMLADGGRGFLHRPVMGYAQGDLRPTYDMLAHPLTIAGGGDGGAHVATICDAGAPTFMLTFWARDRSRGPTLALEQVVRKQTLDTARLYGLEDRGRIAPGLRADLNLIDYPNLALGPLETVYDLPSGAPRLMQKSRGYVATIVAGAATIEMGEDTGARPGKLVRGRRPGASY